MTTSWNAARLLVMLTDWDQLGCNDAGTEEAPENDEGNRQDLER